MQSSGDRAAFQIRESVELIGRDETLAALQARVARASRGLGGLILVSGEAGIGKTAVCEQLVDQALQQGFRSAWVACLEAAVVPPLWPWTQLLQQLDSSLDRVEATQGAVPADPDAARLARFELVRAELSRTSGEGPLLLVIDDLHWADPASMELLAHLVGPLRSMRAVLVATYRPGDAVRGELGDVAQVERHAYHVALLPLDDAAARHLLLRQQPRLAPRLVDEAAHLARGNPLYLIHLARESGLRVPVSAQAALTERVRSFDEATRAMLDVMAVIGDEATSMMLAHVTATAQSQVLAVVDPAIAANVIRQTEPGVYQFSHPLFRAAVYEHLNTAERAFLHLRVGRVLRELGENGVPVQVAALAHHFTRSAPVGDARAAVGYALEAGDQAMSSLAYETAARRYQQALRVLDLEPAAGDRLEMLLSLASALAAQGAVSEARSTYTSAAELARSTHRPREFARAVLGRSGGSGLELSLTDREQVGLLEEAIGELGDSEPALGAWLRARLSVALTLSGRLERRIALAEEAIRLAETAGDDDALAHALAAQCDVIAGPVDVRRREHQARRVVELARSRRSIRLELLGRRLVIEALLEQGRFEEADLPVAAYESAARAVRDPAYDFYAPLWRAALALMRGDQPAFATWHHAVEASVPGGAGNVVVLWQVQKLIRAIDGDEPEAARGALEAMADAAVGIVEPQTAITVALVRSLLGDRDEALATIARVAPEVQSMTQDSEWLPAVVQLADIACEAGNHALVDWTYAALSPFGALWAVEGIGAAIRGPVERALGILAAKKGDTEAAGHHFDRALAACRAAGAALWEQRTLRDIQRCGQHVEPPHPPATAAALVRERDLWRIEFAGTTARVRDSKGMRDIARLLARPGDPVAAVELVTADGQALVQAASGPPIDATALAAYRHRLSQIERELDTADATGDAAESSALLAERDALVSQVASARGLGGRARTTGSSAERARTTVTTRIHETLHRLEAVHPAAARHLTKSLETGTHCVYEPDPNVVWQVSDES
jgi:tetratricopeptide (TPR) repeat protein